MYPVFSQPHKTSSAASSAFMQPSLYSLMMTMPPTTIAPDSHDNDYRSVRVIPSNKRRRVTLDSMDVRMDKLRSTTLSQQCQTLQEPPRKRIKKSVRFADAVEVAFRHATKDELKQSWYSDEDYRQFVEDIRLTIRVYRGMGFGCHNSLLLMDPTRYSVRGIEEHVMQGSFQLKKFKLLSNIRMILDQQALQRSMGISDPNSLKMISMMRSRESRQRALELAALDSTDRLSFY